MNPASQIPCPHCGAGPDHQCGYGTRQRGWTTLILRRYHHSREELAGVDSGPSDWRRLATPRAQLGQKP